MATNADDDVYEYVYPPMSDEDEGGDDNLIPCEFCNELFPFLQIVQHMSGCEPDLLHAPRLSSFQPPQNNKVVAMEDFSTTKSSKSIHEPVEKNSKLEMLAKKLEVNEKAAEEKLSLCVKKTFDMENTLTVAMDEINTNNVDPLCSDTIKQLSEDDDFSESLETFWRRAEEILKKRMGKNIK